MFKKWWLLQHVSGGDWFPARVTTLLGIPFYDSLAYRVQGPYPDLSKALDRLVEVFLEDTDEV